MGLSLPFSRTRRYLTGIDWIVGMFNQMLKQVTGAGNTSQIILQLDRPIAEADLRESFARFAAHFPVLYGRVARDFNLAPFWKIPARAVPTPLRIHVERSGPETPPDEVLRTVARRVNNPFISEDEHLAFSLAYAGDSRCYLGMTFDHRLFDARGAEAFLNLFHRFYSGADPHAVAAGISLIEPAHLSEWKEKFLAGRRANRVLLALREATHKALDFSHLPNPGAKFRFATFDRHRSATLVDAAYRTAGYLMLMPYLLALGIESVHRLFLKKGIDIPDYVIPASFDMRRPNTLQEKLFFNHVSFVFFRVRTADVSDRGKLVNSVKQQFYEAAKSGIMDDFREGSHLMRIAPLGLLSRVARLPLGGQFGSFCFAQVGDTTYSSPAFMNARLVNLFHAPRVPVPPGLGFFFNMYDGQINLVVSCPDSLLADNELDMIIEEFCKRV